MNKDDNLRLREPMIKVAQKDIHISTRPYINEATKCGVGLSCLKILCSKTTR